ncbi:MAG: polysaccharide biosynthesis tyrosine autokinase [Planctomycetota bacterium]|nr:MAG: polysaccharide biosynthesis tyrosine autokinase [Planctomycetota bacterium]
MSEFVTNSPNAEAEEAGFDFWGFLWRRAWLGFLFGTIGATAAYYYYLRQPVVYKATSQVLVIKQQADMPVNSVNGFDPSGQSDPLASDVRLILSEVTVGPAITDGRLKELPSLSGSPNLPMTILAGLSATRTVEGQILDISFKGSDPVDCAKVVNAVVASYDKSLRESYADKGTVVAKLLTNAKDEWTTNLRKLEAEYAEFRKTTSLIYNGESVTSVSESRMAGIEAERSKVLIAQTEVQSQIDAIKKALDRGGSREAITLMLESFNDKNNSGEAVEKALTPMQKFTREIFQLELEEELALLDLGEDHPKVQSIRKRIEMTRKYLSNELDETSSTTGPAKKIDFLEVYVESLQQQKKAGEERLLHLNQLFEEEKRIAKEQLDLQIQDKRYRNDIARSELAFNTIMTQLKDTDLAIKGGNYRTQVLAPATRGVQVEPNFQKTMIMGSALGVLVGLLLGFLVEAADKSFRSPDDISQTLRLPIVGISPQIQLGRRDRTNPIDPAIVTIHRPRSQSAEAFRGVRTYLLAATRGAGHSIVLLTSPEPGDGKSTMSSNLAVALAQTGKSVLLIDADMRRPTVKRLFGLKNNTGLSELLDEVPPDINECIQTVSFEGSNLDILASGECPIDPGERLMSNRMENLLSMLRDRYEWIIIDSPPVLAVTDSATLSRLVDGVILVVRMNGRTRMGAVRAAETLRTLGANILGLIANGIDPTKHGGYGYQYGVYGAGGRASKYYAEAPNKR